MPKNKTGIDNLLAALDKEQSANSEDTLQGTIDRVVAPLALAGRQEPQTVGSFAEQMARPTPISPTPTQMAENVMANAGTPLRLAGIKPPVPPELQREPAPRPTSEGMLVPNPNYETVAGEAAQEIATQKASPQNLLETKNPSLFALNLANEVSGRAGYPQMLKGGKELLAGGIEPGIADVGEGAFKAATPLLIAGGIAQPIRVATGLAGAVATGYAAQKAAEAAGANEDEQRIANLVGAMAGGALTGGKGLFDRTGRLPEAALKDVPNLKGALEKAASANSEPAPTLDATPALKAALAKENQSVGAAGISDNFSNRAANINLDRLQTGEDVLSVIRDTAKASGDFQTQRRGVISHGETAQAAEQLGMTPEQLAKMKPGKALNAEELLAARRINVATSEDVRAAVKNYQANDSTANLLAVQAAMQKHVAVLNSVSGATAEAGRALSQFRIAASALREPTSNYDQVLQRLGGREVTAEIAQKLSTIPEDDLVGLNKFLRGATQFSTADKVSSYWVSNVLSGPRTHLRNLVSNVTFGALQIPQKAIKGLVDIPLSKIANRPQEFYAREAIPAAYGWVAGLPDGLRRAAYIIRNGFDEADAAKLDSPRQYEFPGGAANPINLPGRFLVASDAMSKTMLLQSEIWAMATRQALREGLSGKAARIRITDLVSDPTPDMVSKATDYSRYATFNQTPGAFTQKLIGLRETEIGGIKFGRFIVPFLSTPSNIAKIGFEFSPLGLAKLTKAGLKSPEASEVVAKAAIGSLAMAGFSSLAASGRLTGAAPSSPNQRDAFYRSGKVPFAVKIGSRWVSYNQMSGPLSMTLASTAAFWDAFNDKGEVPTSKRIATAGAVIGSSITDATFFRGIENLINALHDPEKQGERFASDTASGFVPMSGLNRNIANSLDPVIRDPQSIYERIKTGLPIMSEQVPAKLDVFGREQKMEGGEGLLAFSPTRLPEDKPRSDVDAELARLEIFPGKTGDSVTVKNHKATLTREQKAELQQTVGRAMYDSLAALFSSDEYKGLDDEQKQEAATQLIAKAREAGRVSFIGKNIKNFTFDK
jgi:hypothetical protein